jgi:hypothetical protein
MTTADQPTLELEDEQPEPKPRQLCVDCGYHDGYHHEDCHLDEWTEAEKRAAAGDA